VSEPVTIFGLRDVILDLLFLRTHIESEPIMREIGLFLTSQIQIRTAEGRDVHGEPFEPYSEGYAELRRRSGRSANKVNLFMTGSMMSSMDFNTTENTVELFFQGSKDPTGMSNPEKAYYLNENREFFAVSEEDRIRVREIIRNHIRRIRRRRR